MPEKWKKVVRFIGKKEVTTLDEIREYIKQEKLDIKEGSLRSQLAEYVNQNFLTRPKKGAFKQTATGREKVGQWAS